MTAVPTLAETKTRRSRCHVQSLADLKLTPKDLAALAQQGFVVAEYREGRGPFFKLRFRRDGKQIVRYLGQSPDVAAAIRHELDVLRQDHQRLRRLLRWQAAARLAIRNSKAALQKHLGGTAYYYHGFAIRHRRPQKDDE